MFDLPTSVGDFAGSNSGMSNKRFVEVNCSISIGLKKLRSLISRVKRSRADGEGSIVFSASGNLRLRRGAGRTPGVLAAVERHEE